MNTTTTLSDEFDRIITTLEPHVEIDDGTPDADCAAHWECRL